MSPLANLEQRVLSLLSHLNLKPTLDVICEVGALLIEVKEQLPHGEFVPFLHRLKVSVRSSQTYMQCARKAQTLRALPDVSIDKFLRIIRTAKYTQPDPPPDHLAGILPEARVYRADCRKFDGWEGQADLIATDPPWLCTDSYDWLGEWGPQILRPGGLILCQCGVADLPDRIARLTAHGMRFHWLFAMVYDDAFRVRPVRGIASCFRPVIVCSHGKFNPGKVVTSDTYTVRPEKDRAKQLHVWQQPTKPWQHWISRTSKPGAKILDPFAGSSTSAIATMRAGGGRTWIGCDIDPAAVRTSRQRIREEAQNLSAIATEA